MAQLVEHHLAKVGVAGSNPVVRSMNIRAGQHINAGPVCKMARWPSGKAEACKAFTTGSNPVLASKNTKDRICGPFCLLLRVLS